MWTIQWKAFLMLVAFTVNFCVICHCAAKAAPGASHCHSCCGKKEGKSGQTDHNGCQGMQAVKFNLLEKQVASAISSGEQPFIFLTHSFTVPVTTGVIAGDILSLPDQWVYKHAPPDLRVLYQSFLI
jgi:hypothetical protein